MEMIRFLYSKTLSCVLAIICAFALSSAHAQQGEDLEVIASKLDQMKLDFLRPLENSYKFSKLRSSEFFDYDARYRARSREMEILIALHPDGEDSFTSNFPHLEFNRLLANLTPNNDDQEVLVVGWNNSKLKERNADWGAEAYFTPRKAVSDLPNGKLVAFFKAGKGMVVMLYCFDKPDIVPLLLEFMKEEN